MEKDSIKALKLILLWYWLSTTSETKPRGCDRARYFGNGCLESGRSLGFWAAYAFIYTCIYIPCIHIYVYISFFFSLFSLLTIIVFDSLANIIHHPSHHAIYRRPWQRAFSLYLLEEDNKYNTTAIKYFILITKPSYIFISPLKLKTRFLLSCSFFFSDVRQFSFWPSIFHTLLNM